ncbi:MAG TPA: type II toxin-antitoxin system HipA family toxin [Gammaproteobacteria bacterium]|jgi:serine/threonine-protein kinase HipA|nr:type II toxin-antitoxin system HipA family toxin [Gammaproteobacteria bacterium]
MKTQHRTLYLFMNGIHIGTLEKTNKGILTFRYEQSWLDRPGARPISLSLPLIKEPFVGDIVYHFFDNLLPDNSQIRARIQAKFHVTTDQPFDLLAAIGKDCVGAIQMISDKTLPIRENILAEPLSDGEIASVLRGYKNYPLGMIDDLSDFRISIAGAQEKSAFLFYQNKWQRPLGGTPTTHIFKLPIGIIQEKNIDLTHSCENEWLCTQIAKAFGLAVAECEILYFNDVKVLSVKRFDRKLSSDKNWIIRLPQEDICQALGLSSYLKYEADGGSGIKEIMKLLLGSINPEEDRDAFFRSQVLFWLLAAIDGHAKNFSLFIEPEGKYRLTPLYDIISAYPLIAAGQLQKQKIKMAMALSGKNKHYHWHQAQRRYFIETAKQVDYSEKKASIILDEMLDKTDLVIAEVSKKLPNHFPVEISQPIFDGMQFMKKQLL